MARYPTNTTGELAFPRPNSPDGSGCVDMAQDGMELVDYFAAKAMASIVLAMSTNTGTYADYVSDAKANGLEISEQVASVAYDIAEAMLAERERRIDAREYKLGKPLVEKRAALTQGQDGAA
jgi:hypothetical protein